MNIREKVKNFMYSVPVEIIIISLVIISTLLIMAEKAIDFSVPFRTGVLDRIDLIIMLIFLVEFLAKLISDDRNYFIKNYGWIDLIAILPLLIPVYNIILHNFGFDLFISKNSAALLSGTKILRLARTMRIIRVVRILRILRIFRLFKLVGKMDHHISTETNRDEQSLTIPAITILIVVFINYGVLIVQENHYIKMEEENNKALISALTETNADEILELNKNILLLGINNKWKRRISDDDLAKYYTKEEQVTVVSQDDNVKILIISLKDKLKLLRLHELFIIFTVIILLIGFYVHSKNAILSVTRRVS